MMKQVDPEMMWCPDSLTDQWSDGGTYRDLVVCPWHPYTHTHSLQQALTTHADHTVISHTVYRPGEGGQATQTDRGRGAIVR